MGRGRYVGAVPAPPGANDRRSWPRTMERIGKRIAVSIVVMVAMSVSVPTAAAQDDNDLVGTTPPAVSVDPPFVASGRFTPGTRQHLGIAAATIQPARSYRGTLSSTPLAPPATMVVNAGSILWTDVLIPADFDLAANHSITVTDDLTGAVVAVSDFYVDVDGSVHAFPPGGARARSAGAPESGARGSSAASGDQRFGFASDSDVPAKLGVGLVALAALAVLTAHKRHDEMVGPS